MLIKKLFIGILLLSFLSLRVSSLQEDELSAVSAVVIDSDTNCVVYQKNMSETLSMASTTKIMTAIIAIESGKLGCTVTAERDIICEGTSIGIEKGDTFTLETLVWALLLESGNDSAVLISEYLAGSESAFSVMMNEKASEIGMLNSNFVTASGLDDEEHYTTAYDMALLGSYAIKNPVFRKICSSESYKADYISPQISETYTNHNKLLKMYDGVFGVKTGFTKKSGRCLVSACEKDGITLVAVTLKAPDDWNDHIKLYDYCFSASYKTILEADIPRKVKVYGSECIWVELNVDEITICSLYSDNITYVIQLPQFIYAPVNTYDEIGKIVIYLNGEIYKEVSITASTQALPIKEKNTPKYTLLDKLLNILRD